jgi:hypothetical protein
MCPYNQCPCRGWGWGAESTPELSSLSFSLFCWRVWCPSLIHGHLHYSSVLLLICLLRSARTCRNRVSGEVPVFAEMISNVCVSIFDISELWASLIPCSFAKKFLLGLLVWAWFVLFLNMILYINMSLFCVVRAVICNLAKKTCLTHTTCSYLSLRLV